LQSFAHLSLLEYAEMKSVIDTNRVLSSRKAGASRKN